MFDIDKVTKQKIIDENMFNSLELVFENTSLGTISMSNIVSESMKLKQSLFDEDARLKFGGAVASQFEVDLCDTEELNFSDVDFNDEWFVAKLSMTHPSGEQLYPKGRLFPSNTTYSGEAVKTASFEIFKGYVDEVKQSTEDKTQYHLTALDGFGIWHNRSFKSTLISIWKQSSTHSCKMGTLLLPMTTTANKFNLGIYNDSSLDKVLNEKFKSGGTGTEGVKMQDWVLDNQEWYKSPPAEDLKYGTIIKDIAELMGCFAYISSSGRNKRGALAFKSLFLTGTPQESYSFHEQFTDGSNIKAYNQVTLNGVKDTYDIKITSGTQSYQRTYNMTDNVLAIEGGDDDITELYLNGDAGGRLKQRYRTFSATVDGRPWVEVGDVIQITHPITDIYGDYVWNSNGTRKIKYRTLTILSRELTGIQALTDTISAKGV